MRGKGSRRAIPAPESILPKTARPRGSGQITNAIPLSFSDGKQPPKLRIAAANSATLLVAATFEEFIREMAREYARAVVLGVEKFDKLPSDLVGTA